MNDHYRHYMPLTIFTLLAIFAVALALTATVIDIFTLLSAPLYLLLNAAILMALAIVISFLHLGQKSKAPLVATGIGRSWLSHEALAAGLFLGLTTMATINHHFQLFTGIQAVLQVVAALSGLALMLVIASLYNLVGQLTWQGFSNLLTPVISAIYLAMLLANTLAGNIIHVTFLLVIYLADLLLFTARLSHLIGHKRHSYAVSFPGLIKWATLLLFLRAILTGLVGTFVLLGYSLPGMIIIAVCIVLDRFAFFAGKMQASPSAEIAAQKNERMMSAIEKTIEEPAQ